MSYVEGSEKHEFVTRRGSRASTALTKVVGVWRNIERCKSCKHAKRITSEDDIVPFALNFHEFCVSDYFFMALHLRSQYLNVFFKSDLRKRFSNFSTSNILILTFRLVCFS